VKISGSLPEPGDLSDGILGLHLREISEAIPERGWVPAYHFTIVLAETQEPIGLLSLRVGETESLRMYAGQIGYAIAESHRGRRLAARAARLAVPLAHRLGLDPVWITCDPANAPSRRTLEMLGAEYVDEVEIPEGHEMYAMGARVRARYRLATSRRDEGSRIVG